MTEENQTPLESRTPPESQTPEEPQPPIETSSGFVDDLMKWPGVVYLLLLAPRRGIQRAFPGGKVHRATLYIVLNTVLIVLAQRIFLIEEDPVFRSMVVNILISSAFGLLGLVIAAYLINTFVGVAEPTRMDDSSTFETTLFLSAANLVSLIFLPLHKVPLLSWLQTVFIGYLLYRFLRFGLDLKHDSALKVLIYLVVLALGLIILGFFITRVMTGP